MARSIEEQVEDWAKADLKGHGIRLYYKSDHINDAIAHALKSAPSKSGGNGTNTPDIKCLIRACSRDIPVMIEVKGIRGRLVKPTAGGGGSPTRPPRANRTTATSATMR